MEISKGILTKYQDMTNLMKNYLDQKFCLEKKSRKDKLMQFVCNDIHTKLNSFVRFCLDLFFSFDIAERVILMPRIIKLYSNVYLMCVFTDVS